MVDLLEVPRGVVVHLGGGDRPWEERQDPVDAHHLKTMLLERVEAGLGRGEFPQTFGVRKDLQGANFTPSVNLVHRW